jgi:cysteinyl-tRNA synthetase
MALHLTNTLSGKKEIFKPLGDTVKIYICGMTVQGPPHFGHMRAYITADILIRYLAYSYPDHKLRVVQNFTDIDDKVIEKSKELEKSRKEKIDSDYRAIAEKHIQEYYEVADQMNIRRVDFYPKATQHIQEIIVLIERLIKKGYAYESGGDIYFAVEKFSAYGKLSKKKLDDLIAGARVEIREQKKNPADFALWKASKPNEPWWESPWGHGRPGWAIECSAMSMHYLGETLDLHLGGEDLIFPHHENEIAQSEAATGKPFVRYWIHNSMLNLTGEKMSKSTKHFITAKELLEKYKYPNILRLYFLKSHYRSPQEFDFEILDSNKESWARIEEFLYKAEEMKAEEKLLSNQAIKSFREAMDDDLNTPKVIAMIFDAVKDGFAAIQNKNIDNLTKTYTEVLFNLRNLGFKTDVKSRMTKIMGHEVSLKDRIESQIIVSPQKIARAIDIAKNKNENGIIYLLEYGEQEKNYQLFKIARELARAKKQFDIADLIRKELEEMGYTLEDSDKGTRIKRKS